MRKESWNLRQDGFTFTNSAPRLPTVKIGNMAAPEDKKGIINTPKGMKAPLPPLKKKMARLPNLEKAPSIVNFQILEAPVPPPAKPVTPPKKRENVKQIISDGLKELELVLGNLNIEVPAEKKTVPV